MLRSGIVAACALAAGCSLTLDFDELADASVDAPPADAPGVDAPLGMWQNTRAVDELNGPTADLKISLTADGLEAYFDSDRGGDRAIYVTSRADLNAPFALPTLVPELASLAFDGHSAVSDDGLTLLFARDIGVPNGVEIHESTRLTRADPWGAPALVPSLSSVAIEDGPDLSADGQTLVFSSTRNGTRDLFIADRNGADWIVTELTTLNSPDDEFDPDISADLLELYFARRVAGVATIMTAVRANTASPFEIAVEVPELGDVAGPRLSSDRRTIYFHRNEGTPGLDLFTATR